MEHEDFSLPRLQEPDTGLYPKTGEGSIHTLYSYLFKAHYNTTTGKIKMKGKYARHKERSLS